MRKFEDAWDNEDRSIGSIVAAMTIGVVIATVAWLVWG